MLSERYDLPFDLPLKPSFCLHLFLLLIHMLGLQVVVAMDWGDMGIGVFLIALLLRHYQQYLHDDPSRRFASFTFRSGTGWQLIGEDSKSLSVRVSSVRWLGPSWALIQLIPESSEETSIVLVLCPDVLSPERASDLKRYLILYRKPPSDDVLRPMDSEAERS
jgi:hypothetical protein